MLFKSIAERKIYAIIRIKGGGKMQEFIWNPWHGCHKYSEGCSNCYVYRRDDKIGKNASEITKNKTFDMPIKKNRSGEYKIPDGSTVYCCMTSDFFLEEADKWRGEVWDIIRCRNNVNFIIITKRIVRFSQCIPSDWGIGWNNVTVCCTVENQRQCDIRLPVFKEAPIKHKIIVCEPLLSEINLEAYLDFNIEKIITGGESGNQARICKYSWVLDIREQCKRKGIPFYFKQTGARFEKDGKLYRVLRKYQHSQARKANINLQ